MNVIYVLLQGEEIRSQSNTVSPADQEAEPEEEDEVMSEEEEEQLSDVVRVVYHIDALTRKKMYEKICKILIKSFK